MAVSGLSCSRWDQTQALCLESVSLGHWTSREIPGTCIFSKLFQMIPLPGLGDTVAGIFAEPSQAVGWVVGVYMEGKGRGQSVEPEDTCV